MKHDYPARLSVAGLRQELDAYLEYRQPKVESITVRADKSHIGLFLGWLDTGHAGWPDAGETDELVQEFGGTSP